jgi:DNA-directed RNA polymerase specialized sigma24 family protein
VEKPLDHSSRIENALVVKQDHGIQYSDRRERFACLIRKLSQRCETVEEFEELGTILLQQTIFFERWYGYKKDEEGAHAHDVYLKVNAHAARLAEVENPWGMLQALIRNTLLDDLKRRKRHNQRTVDLHGAGDSDDIANVLENLDVASDPSPGPALVAMAGDDWRQMEIVLSDYHNPEHVVFFRDWAVGWRVVDIAEDHGVTENTIQLAILRVRLFVQRAVLRRDQGKVETMLREYPHPQSVGFFWAWVAGRDEKAISVEAGLMKREVQSAIQEVMRFVLRHWGE